MGSHSAAFVRGVFIRVKAALRHDPDELHTLSDQEIENLFAVMTYCADSLLNEKEARGLIGETEGGPDGMSGPYVPILAQPENVDYVTTFLTRMVE
jgi:hypothetical protein